MRVRFSRRALLLASLSSTVLTSGAALAQEAANARDDEIVVTAQKREENLQDVPISIQALGTRKLDQLNVANFQDFSKLLPSVSFQSSQPGVTTVYMRGVASGGDGNHSGSLPSVGVYLDEQPVTTIGGTLDVHVYDIARIESLAGRKARCTAPRRRPARSASSPTSRAPPGSKAASMASSTASSMAAWAVGWKA